MTFYLNIFLLLSSLRPIYSFESLVQAQVEVRKDLPSTPLHFAAPDWNYYHRTYHVHRDLLSLSTNCPHANLNLYIAQPDGTHQPISSTFTKSASDGLVYARIKPQKEPAVKRAKRFATGLLHSSSSNSHPPDATIMFICGEEGRDLISAEIALKAAQKVCSIPNSLPHYTEIVIVAIANPDGRRIAEMGRRCDRANGNDVDITRNWPAYWGQEHTDLNTKGINQHKKSIGIRAAVSRRLAPLHHGSIASYHDTQLSIGIQPFSETETKVLSSIIDTVRPVAFVPIRTGNMAITTPWDCQVDKIKPEQYDRMKSITRRVVAAHCTSCATGTILNITNRRKCGTASDYVFGTKHVPFVHTWYVYHDTTAASGDCFKRHNPTSSSLYNRVTENWAFAMLNYTAMIQNWITLENLFGIDGAKRNASIPVEEFQIPEEKVETDTITESVVNPDVEVNNDTVPKEANIILRDEAEGRKLTISKTPLFQWVFTGTTRRKKENFEHTDRKKDKRSASLHEKGIKINSDPASALAGWFGVWAALVLLSSLFYVAKRHVFKRGRRRSPFHRQVLVKRA